LTSECEIPRDAASGRLMPKYRCHKVVSALQIDRIEPDPSGAPLWIHFVERDHAPLAAELGLFARYVPTRGDYLVVYRDGYKSVSPKAEFEDGYTKRPAAPADGKPDRMLKLFAYGHLRPDLLAVSKAFAELAEDLVVTVPAGPERTVALRKLLEAKDAAVRAVAIPEGV
jgi:hypothetical protein